MTQENNLKTSPVNSTAIAKPMLIGAGIGLIVISFFVLGVDEPDPLWPKFWMIRPLLIVPFAGAMGGVVYYLMGHMRNHGGWKKVLANIISLIIFIIGLWMGTVLGLVGTMWH